MKPALAFDLETVPDVDSARRLHDFSGLPDAEVAQALFALRRQETGGSDFLRHPLHRVVAIAIVLRGREGVQVGSLGSEATGEAGLIRDFFGLIERHTPVLVSWNGSGFDLPVLHYRALLHGIAAPRYWEMGDDDASFRYNNYLSRFHWRHVDLMDVLSGYQTRATAPLDLVAQLLGQPGKMGMSGSQVWEAWLAGDRKAIRDYCETDALNTWLIYLRFERMRGRLSAEACQQEQALLEQRLEASDAAHLRQFLHTWRQRRAAAACATEASAA